MKALLLAFCLLAGNAWSVAANTVSLWNLNNSLGDDSGNGYALAQVGVVPFVTTPTPPEGTHWAGPWDQVNYARSSDVRVALSNSTTYTIECYMHSTTLALQQQFLTAGSVAGSSIVLAVTTDGRAKFVTDDVNVYQSAAGVITANTTYYFAVVVNGTNLKIYVGTVGAVPTVVVDTTATSPGFPTGGFVNVGVYGLAPSFLPASFMYLDSIRISSVARTSLPTTDGNPQINPYQWNGTTPLKYPAHRMLMLLPLWTAPSRLQALAQDQRPVAKQIRVLSLRDSYIRDKTMMDADIKAGRVTPTRTPVPVAVTLTPTTPGSTPSATLTPATIRER